MTALLTALLTGQNPNLGQGKVYLVGAGMGRMDYLTLRAQQVLQQAEVVIYDALVDEAVLGLVAGHCDRIFVGKRGGLPSTEQATINQLLVNYCQQGKQVVRLKSGDPLIFGRVTPEIQALIAAHCPYELIPGISSALAAPLLAGIPLTDKKLGRCFAVLSAHDPTLLDWESLARIDTLVVLMGGKQLPEIVAQLQQHGRSPRHPIAIIRHAGAWHQQQWFGTLETIVTQTVGMTLSPAIMVIGELVNQRFMTSIPALPLAGYTVLITRAADPSSQFRDLLQAQGAIALDFPALEIGPPSSWAALDQAIQGLDRVDWLILTSANGVNYFFERLQAQGLDARHLAGVKIAVVGKKTAAVLKGYGINPDFMPPDFVAEALVEHFPVAITNLTLLFPRVESGGREILVKALTAQGAEVLEVPAYQSGCPTQIEPTAWQALQERRVDIVTFASSKTVQHFHQLVSLALAKESSLGMDELLRSVKFASIGPQTTKSCQELLGRVDIEAQEYTLEGLTQAIGEYVQNTVPAYPTQEYPQNDTSANSNRKG